ncbi:MAG: CTP-dependent riboflavin kinase [Candidatus Altiarchaeota archaeon]|nr:CTP-dependent riboflavin kinase [Candidatus Altiarchaeota archaeon]
MDELELVLIRLAEILEDPNAKTTVTSTELAGKLGVSQQTASRHLIKLEKEEYITRATHGKRQDIQLTEKGITTLKKTASILNAFLGRRRQLTIDGSVVSGLGEGAYYIKQYEWKIMEALGFRPYPGTLNVRIEGDNTDLLPYSAKKIEGFSHGGRHFGALDLILVEIEVKGHKVECFIAIPERTHHQKEFEVVSHFNLRSKYNLKDGDGVKIILKSSLQ